MKKMMLLLLTLTTLNALAFNHDPRTSSCSDFLNAVRDDYVPLVKKCITRGTIYINGRDKDGNVPLMYAIKSKSFNVANYLIDSGANVKIKNEDGMDILDMSETYSNLRLLKKVLDKGFKVEVRLAALGNDSIEVVKFLTDLGAKVSEETLGEAIWLSSHNLIKYFVRELKMDVNMSNADKMFINYVHNVETLKVLLSLGADLSIEDKDGKNIIHYLSARFTKIGVYYTDVLSTIEAVTKLGLDINSRDNEGKTGLFYLRNYQPEVVQKLIRLGADINVRDNKGNNILLNSAYTNLNENYVFPQGLFVDALHLLKLGMDLNSENFEGKNLLELTEERCKTYAISETDQFYCKSLPDQISNF